MCVVFEGMISSWSNIFLSAEPIMVNKFTHVTEKQKYIEELA